MGHEVTANEGFEKAVLVTTSDPLLERSADTMRSIHAAWRGLGEHDKERSKRRKDPGLAKRRRRMARRSRRRNR